MKAGEIMSTGAAAIRGDATLLDAIRIMVEHRISGLPVVDAGGGLVGVVTEGDFLPMKAEKRSRLLEVLTTGGMAARELGSRRVEEIMTRDPVAVDPETPLEDAIETMRRHGIKRLPVVMRGQVVGILSRSDVIAALLRKARLGEGRPQG